VAIYDNVVNSLARFASGRILRRETGIVFEPASSAMRALLAININYIRHIYRRDIVLHCINRRLRVAASRGACAERRKRIQLQAFDDNVAAERVIDALARRRISTAALVRWRNVYTATLTTILGRRAWRQTMMPWVARTPA
jgi:hypothetical protein